MVRAYYEGHSAAVSARDSGPGQTLKSPARRLLARTVPQYGQGYRARLWPG
jgi:hypothetical protein